MSCTLTADYHIHSDYSDGHDDMATIIRRAHALGLQTIAITEHGPTNPSYSLAKARRQRQEIDRLKQTAPLQVLFGNEHDLISADGQLDVDEKDWELFDLHLAGFHQFSQSATMSLWWQWYLPNILPFARGKAGVIQRNTQAVLACLRRYKVDILTHLNHRMIVDMDTVAKACAEVGTLIELNVKHLDAIAPCMDSLARSGVQLVIDTDAHRAADIGEAQEAIDLVCRYDLCDRVINLGGSNFVFRSQRHSKEVL